MLDFLWTNKEWLFSGGGVTAILAIIAALFKWLPQRFAHKPKTLLSSRDVASTVPIQSSSEFNSKNESEVTKIAKRFRRILDLMNGGRSYAPYTIAGLAEIMSLNSVGELESVFLGEKEPPFEFIKSFCETFGINKQWLLEGKESPFSDHDLLIYDPLDCLNLIQQFNPQKVLFIRSSSEVGEVFILLKMADWKFKIFPEIWHISDHVGGGGRGQIFSLYRLILTLQKQYGSSLCGGRILPKEQFEALSSGELFPGAAIPSHENPWWDDFVDVHHKYPVSSSYEANYGKGFIEAQAIVRQKLQEEIVP